VEFASMAGIVIFPGALTPTEVITAWRAGSDFVKVVPCAAIGGKEYLKSLTIALPDIPLIAAGGINQQTAEDYLEAGAVALGIGEALIPSEAIAHRQPKRIHELARRFLQFVRLGRLKNDSRIYEAVVDRTQNLHLENVAT
jgi:2-dehydro-3-deoxyphosphogluconate aldolase / (4S)-4-hydroxy-2-oxoglutarate aldolase